MHGVGLLTGNAAVSHCLDKAARNDDVRYNIMPSINLATTKQQELLMAAISVIIMKLANTHFRMNPS